MKFKISIILLLCVLAVGGVPLALFLWDPINGPKLALAVIAVVLLVLVDLRLVFRWFIGLPQFA